MSDQVHKPATAAPRPEEVLPHQIFAPVPDNSSLKPYLTREEFIAMPKADRGLLADLEALSSEETDTVGPLE